MTELVTVTIDNAPIDVFFYDDNTLESLLRAQQAETARAAAAASAALATAAFDNLYDDFATGAAASATGVYFGVLDTTLDRALVYLKGTSVDADDPVIRLPGAGRLNSTAGAAEIGAADGKTAQDKFTGLQRNLRELPGSTADGTTSNQTSLEALVALGQGIIPAQDSRLVLTAPLPTIAAGTKVYFQGGPRILYTGAELGSPSYPDGPFRLGGDDIEFVSLDGTKMEIEFENPGRSQYAFVGRGVSRTTLRGLRAVNGNVAYFNAPDDGAGAELDYGDIDTDEATGNCGFDNKVEDWECVFDDPSDAQYRGAVSLFYNFRARVRRGECVNVDHGVQEWCGNASHLADGAIANERKGGEAIIEHIIVRGAKGCIVWASMSRDTVTRNCEGWDAGDVAFDAEGCVNYTFESCVQHGAENAHFSTYFFGRNTRFVNCRGFEADPTKKIFRISNQPQSFDNRDAAVLGGHFEFTTGIGDFGAEVGGVRVLTIDDNQFVNCRILAQDNNNNTIIITNNRLRFTVASATRFDAILFGGANEYSELAGNSTVSGNQIRSEVGQPVGSCGIRSNQYDFNAATQDEISTNRIFGFDVPIRVGFSGTNTGFPSHTIITGNRMDVNLIQLPIGTFTVVAATDVVTTTIKGMVTGQICRASSTTTLPAGLASATNYYWIRIDDATGKFATSEANALAGTAIDITDTGTGAHTMLEGVVQATATVPTGSNLTTAGASVS
ncbi:MAG: hypothetical protein KKA05_11105 [Alphaproteobacteria bacterium]|nr:hypothetical protein [Alphaproteobacteria bacterium]